MITKESQRAQVLKRLRQTRRDETICLWGWEIQVLLEYINELKGVAEHGTSEVQTADSKGTDADNRI